MKNKPLKEKNLIEQTLGQVEPKTEKEKKLLKEIQEIKKKGRIVEIPKDFL
jgi:hypothetical protein